VAVGRTYLLPPLSSGGASLVLPWLRFHTPLIEPDMQICRIRLSDKTSRLHPRRAATKPCEAYELEVPVKLREWIAPALASPDFVLESEPPAQPHSRVAVERAICFAGGADTEVIGPISFSVNGSTWRSWTLIAPTGLPSRNIGTASTVCPLDFASRRGAAVGGDREHAPDILKLFRRGAIHGR
jgi:hypothetical protein